MERDRTPIRRLADSTLFRAGTAGLLGLLATLPLAATALGNDDADRRRAAAAEDLERTPSDVAMELDFLIAEAWKAEGLEPTERTNDEEFLRRVYLDLVGTVPAPWYLDRNQPR